MTATPILHESSGLFTRSVTIDPFNGADDAVKKRKGFRSYSWLAALILKLFCCQNRLITYKDANNRIYRIAKKDFTNWLHRHGIAIDEYQDKVLDQATIENLIDKVIKTNFLIKKELSHLTDNEVKQAIVWTADENPKNNKRWAYIKNFQPFEKSGKLTGISHFSLQKPGNATEKPLVKHLFIIQADGSVTTKPKEIVERRKKSVHVQQLAKIKKVRSDTWIEKTHEWGLYILKLNTQGKQEYTCVGYFGTQEDVQFAAKHLTTFETHYTKGPKWLGITYRHLTTATALCSQIKVPYWTDEICPANKLAHENIFKSTKPTK